MSAGAFRSELTRSASASAASAAGQRTAGQGPSVALSKAAAPIEEAIIHVFESTLGVSGLGPEDNFFDLGGTSLLGVQLTAELESLLGRPVPLVLLFQEATPRSIAFALVEYPSDTSRNSMVLQPGEGGASIFCTPDFFGLPLSYLGLARRLAAAYTVHGLAPGPLRAEMIRRPSIELLTRAYCAEIRRLQPRGPYVVSGYSAGSVSAFDLACQLEQDGERVLLVLLDPMMSRGMPPLPFMIRWWRAHVLPRVAEVGWARAIREMQRLRNSLLHIQRIVTPLNVPRGVPLGDRGFARSMLQAEVDWRERRFHGEVVFGQISLRGAAEVFIDHDGLNGWRRFFLGEVETVSIASDHMGLMREPHVAELAERLLPRLASFLRPGLAPP